MSDTPATPPATAEDPYINPNPIDPVEPAPEHRGSVEGKIEEAVDKVKDGLHHDG